MGMRAHAHPVSSHAGSRAISWPFPVGVQFSEQVLLDDLNSEPSLYKVDFVYLFIYL